MYSSSDVPTSESDEYQMSSGTERSVYMDYWLPEFEPTEGTMREDCGPWLSLESKVRRGRWLKKDQLVTMREDPPTNSGVGSIKVLQLLSKESEGPVVQRCRCAVCRLMNVATVRSPPVFKRLVRNIEVVDQGTERFTLYDKYRPWCRKYVTSCTNPLPLTRRMPPLTNGSSEALNKTYRMQMFHPGKVIKNPHKMSED